VDVVAPVRVSHHAEPGVVWRRVVDAPQGTVIHLINLVDQVETGWDTAKVPAPAVTDLTLRVRRSGGRLPRVRVADPDRGPCFRQLPVSVDGEHVVAALPPLGVWQIVLVEQP
jgi:dextranase